MKEFHFNYRYKGNITFFQIRFEPPLDKSSLFLVVFKSKSPIYQILNWKYCSPHFWDDHVTYINM